MSAASACFKWADILETQFDKSWADLDRTFNVFDESEEDGDAVLLCRKQAASLASCFSQLSHKATVVFQNNAKLEAELVHLREELSNAKLVVEKITSEKDYLTHQLQAALLTNHNLKHNGTRSQQEEMAPVPASSPTETVGNSVIETNALTSPRSNGSVHTDNSSISKSQDDSHGITNQEVASPSNSRQIDNVKHFSNPYLSEILFAENSALRREILELESELIGARMDNVYLDKELAGRIQQIQLLASNTNADVKEKMWAQIESEMCLQRAKTISQICKIKQALRGRNMSGVESRPETQRHPSTSSRKVSHDSSKPEGEEEELGNKRGKQVMVLKNPADDLGMAIVGGKEHHLPIIISEVFPNSAVSRANKLRAGDVILSVNGHDFLNMSHMEAVNFLSVLRGQIVFELRSAEDLSEDDPSNLDFRFYKIFEQHETNLGGKISSLGPVSGSNNNCVQLGSPVTNHPGKAVQASDILQQTSYGSGLQKSPQRDVRQLPTIHSSRQDSTELSKSGGGGHSQPSTPQHS